MSTLESSKPQEKWLNCHVEKGMFSDERAVTYPAAGNTKKSVFVSSAVVKGQPGQQGKVLVRVIRGSGHFWAILPSSNQDMVSVSESDVSDE